MTSSGNSIFIKDILDKDGKKKFAEFFDLPEKVFEKSLGVLDVINFEESSNETHSLLLFHYAIHNAEKFHTFGDEFTPEVIIKLLSIRGIVVAQKGNNLRIVDRSFGYTKVQISDQLPEGDLLSKDGDKVEVMYKLWIHGALIRCFKYEGVVYASTHRKISCAKSTFGRSGKTFEMMLLGDQNVFPTLDSIFSGEMDNESYVHLFILNNRDLIIEAGVFLSEDSVYYIGTIDLVAQFGIDVTSEIIKNYITSLNSNATKPIKFPQVLSRDEVNVVLRGESEAFLQMPIGGNVREINDFLRELPTEFCLNLYKRQGSVIAHVNGKNGMDVFRIVPTSKRNASLITNGVPNPAKIFTDLLAKYANGTLLDEIPLIPVGFTINQLKHIASLLENYEYVDFSYYERIKVSVPELILTAVIFSSPNTLVNEAITAYEEFGGNVIEISNFLFLNRGDDKSSQSLERAIKTRDNSGFDGFINLNKTAKEYMIKYYLGCFFEKSKTKEGSCITSIIGDGILPHWHPEVIAEFKLNKAAGTIEAKQKNALLAFISNAPPDALYSLLQFKSKVLKTRAAFAKGK